MNIQEKADREAFEKWYKGRFTRNGQCYMDVSTLQPSIDGGYKAIVQEAYEGWCAALRTERAKS